MSDLRIKVKYHDIEIETSVPFAEFTSSEWGKRYTMDVIESTINQSHKVIQELLEAGRKTLAT